MNSIQNWLRQFSARMGAGLRGFMAGRYGTDKLNMLILGIGLVASLLSMWIRVPSVNLVLFVLSYGMMIWAISGGFPGTPTSGIRKIGSFCKL